MSTDTRDERPAPPALHGNHSKVIRRGGDFNWEGVELEAYKATTETWKGIIFRNSSRPLSFW